MHSLQHQIPYFHLSLSPASGFSQRLLTESKLQPEDQSESPCHRDCQDQQGLISSKASGGENQAFKNEEALNDLPTTPRSHHTRTQ